jgi:hypothetical protein
MPSLAPAGHATPRPKLVQGPPVVASRYGPHERPQLGRSPVTRSRLAATIKRPAAALTASRAIIPRCRTHHRGAAPPGERVRRHALRLRAAAGSLLVPTSAALIYLLEQSALPQRALGGRRQPHQKATSASKEGGAENHPPYEWGGGALPSFRRAPRRASQRQGSPGSHGSRRDPTPAPSRDSCSKNCLSCAACAPGAVLSDAKGCERGHGVARRTRAVASA